MKTNVNSSVNCPSAQANRIVLNFSRPHSCFLGINQPQEHRHHHLNLSFYHHIQARVLPSWPTQARSSRCRSHPCGAASSSSCSCSSASTHSSAPWRASSLPSSMSTPSILGGFIYHHPISNLSVHYSTFNIKIITVVKVSTMSNVKQFKATSLYQNQLTLSKKTNYTFEQVNPPNIN